MNFLIIVLRKTKDVIGEKFSGPSISHAGKLHIEFWRVLSLALFGENFRRVSAEIIVCAKNVSRKVNCPFPGRISGRVRRIVISKLRNMFIISARIEIN